jgi:hypothetical protein
MKLEKAEAIFFMCISQDRHREGLKGINKKTIFISFLLQGEIKSKQSRVKPQFRAEP